MTPQQTKMAEGRKLRDKLTAEGRHRDAAILQSVIRSAECSAGINRVYSRNLTDLKGAAKAFRAHHIIAGCRPVSPTGELRDLFNALDELLG